MRDLSETLLAAQQSDSRIPCVKVVINETDYTDRVLNLEHREEPYREMAIIILRNDDRHFNNTNLLGQKFQIGYGDYTGETVAEPDGDAAGNEYAYTSDLWVKSQMMVSAEGQLYCQLYCEGHWAYMREQRLTNYGDPPYYSYSFEETTIYDMIEAVIETVLGWTLEDLGDSDSIIDVLTPTFDLNEMPYELAAEVLYRLIYMTKSFIRSKADDTFEIVYPQEDDAVDETYYSYQQPYFYEYNEKANLLIPNSIKVFSNRSEDGTWDDIVTGEVEDTVQSALYTEVVESHIYGSITTEAEADLIAQAILSKYKAEQLAGRLIIPHDARVELYDRVAIYDARGL